MGMRGVGTGTGCGARTCSATETPMVAARDIPAIFSSVKPTCVMTAWTLKSADPPTATISKRSLSPTHIDLSTALATILRCISERPALEAVSENDVGIIRTVFAAKTSLLLTLIPARVRIPSPDARFSYEDNAPVCSKGTVAQPAVRSRAAKLQTE